MPSPLVYSMQQETTDNRLFFNAESGNLVEVRKSLKKGANPNKEIIKGKTAIHIAALHGHLAIVNLLLEKGVDINKTDQYGITPIYLAAAQGHLAIVEVLWFILHRVKRSFDKPYSLQVRLLSELRSYLKQKKKFCSLVHKHQKNKLPVGPPMHLVPY